MTRLYKSIFLSAFLICNFQSAICQSFTHADTLRGSNGPARDWWDIQHYDLNVKFNIKDSTISGFNQIQFKVLRHDSIMQIDLQEPLMIDSFYITVFSSAADSMDRISTHIKSSNTLYPDTAKKDRDGNAYFLKIPDSYTY